MTDETLIERLEKWYSAIDASKFRRSPGIAILPDISINESLKLRNDLREAIRTLRDREDKIRKLKRYTCDFTDCRYQRLGKALEAKADALDKVLERLGDTDEFEDSERYSSKVNWYNAELFARMKFARAAREDK